jgi:surfeit locus 1 family protein
MKNASRVAVAAVRGSLNPVQPQPRSTGLRLFLVACAALVVITFLALGVWQVQRLAWKTALIARVDARVHAPPVTAPETASWSQVNAESDAYRHVRVTGVFLDKMTSRVQAVTELGSGFWLLTPLCRTDGSIVLINRGFVPAGLHFSEGVADPVPAALAGGACAGAKNEGRLVHEVTGLLRLNEPGGAFLRHNDARAGRWYSRDVLAMAAALGLSPVAPYFIDADAGQEAMLVAPSGSPAGGLTVIVFHNSHLVYAFTWFALALLTVGGFWWATREEHR